MTNYDASSLDCNFVQCAVCDEPIAGSEWFSRIKHGKRTVALCCPFCLEAFEADPRPYLRRIETIELMKSADRVVRQELLA
jgi:hypothetical protein